MHVGTQKDVIVIRHFLIVLLCHQTSLSYCHKPSFEKESMSQICVMDSISIYQTHFDAANYLYRNVVQAHVWKAVC